jgi:DNA-binding transcriptional LysR family regulator
LYSKCAKRLSVAPAPVIEPRRYSTKLFMSIRALKTFLAVARHGTFAAAAKEIGLTQAAVSLQMKGLESELNTQLFDRSGRAVILNTAGRTLIPTAAEIVGLYDDMSLSVSGSNLGGSLRIGAVPPTFAKLLPESLLSLKADYPRVDVRVMSGMSDDLAAKVERGELDAALVSDPPEPLSKGLILHPIVREPLVFVAPSRVRMTRVKDVLSEEPFIWLSRHSWTGRFIDQTLRRHNVKVDTVMELDTPDGISEMVARGFGVSIIPLYDARWLSDPRLRIWRFRQPRLERGVGLVERRVHTRTTLTATFLTHLLDVKAANRRTFAIKATTLV